MPDSLQTGYLPLDHANLLLFPEILTRFSDPDSAPKAFDGRVGALLENDYLITSPNSQFLFEPPSTPRRPFNEQYPHLPLIRAPSADANHPFAAAWAIPSNEILDTDAGDILRNRALLRNDFYLRIKRLALYILDEIPSAIQKSLDVYLSRGASQVRHMLEILQMSAAPEILFLRVTFLQRNLLELDARIRYIGMQFQGSLFTSKPIDIPGCLDVIGAFTDQLATVDDLYHHGIPVWFVRRVEDNPDARIDRSVHVIAEDSLQCFELPSGFRVDGTDADPPHRIIWDGLPNNTERYAAMSTYLQSLLASPTLFGVAGIRSISSVSRVEQISKGVRSVAGPSSSLSPLSKPKSMPYTKQPNARINPQNVPSSSLMSLPKPKFMPYTKQPNARIKPQNETTLPKKSELLFANPVWSRVTSSYEKNDFSVGRPDNVDSGYFLPPPRLLDGPLSSQSRAFYYRSWLRIRPLIFLSLTGSISPVKLSAKHWRSLLDIAGGHPLSNVATSKDAPSRGRMRTLLEDLLNQAQMRFFEFGTNVTPQIEKFNGQPIDCRNEPPPKESSSRILIEISELSFRHELIALDELMDESGLPLNERNVLRDQCWLGSRNEVDAADTQGFSAFDIRKRASYIRALHQLMSTWKGDKPDVLYRSFPTNSEAHNYPVILETFEYSLAQFYVTSFISEYWRLPSTPHYVLDK
ncbi:hypothetical protein EV360DRAFT_86147 [Lentinula raphanica]|nr:hypothetical protein EV360DRAFT_86147 [Lentinula raphanica]